MQTRPKQPSLHHLRQGFLTKFGSSMMWLWQAIITKRLRLATGGNLNSPPGTDSFIADFERFTRKCIDAVGQGESGSGVRESFELLFGLLRYIDEGNDNVLFFADDGSSSDVGVNWHVVLPAYFNCLAKTSTPEEFARTVNETIADFVSYDQPSYMNTAGNVASDEQRVALDAFVVTGK